MLSAVVVLSVIPVTAGAGAVRSPASGPADDVLPVSRNGTGPGAAVAPTTGGVSPRLGATGTGTDPQVPRSVQPSGPPIVTGVHHPQIDGILYGHTGQPLPDGKAGDTADTGAVTVATVTVRALEVIAGSPALDPDGDGVYEDVNGDGAVTPGDATVLFEEIF